MPPARASFRPASLAAGLVLFILFLFAGPATADPTAVASDLPYDQPAPGGQVVKVVYNVTVGRRAPDCFGARERKIDGRGECDGGECAAQPNDRPGGWRVRRSSP